MRHGSSFLEEFLACKAFEEVREKASCTDAKSMEKSTEGLHQAQYCLVSSLYRATRAYVFQWVSGILFFFFRTPTFLQGCLCLLFYSPKLYRSWQKFRSKWVSSMLDCGCLSQSKHTVESVSLCLFYRLLIVYLSICCLICCCHWSHLFIESILLSSSLNPITLILYVVKWNLLIDGF